MSDFGLFESDEATQAEPRLAARTAARQLEAAIHRVRTDFGRFLIAATGIDEFEDRWHLSKTDIRKAVEPLVFPNTGTMRRIQNAMKADWKLAHPYKLAEGIGDLGGQSQPSGIGGFGGVNDVNTNTGFPGESGGGAYSSGIGSFGGGPSVDTSIVGPGIGSGPVSGQGASFGNAGSQPSGGVPSGGGGGGSSSMKSSRHLYAEDRDAPFQDLDETFHPSSGNLIPEGDFHGYQDSVDQDGPEKVQNAFTPGGDSGSSRKAARSPKCDCDAYNHPSHVEGEYVHSESCPRYDMYEDEDDSGKKEAAMLVADIYTDFAQSNGLRVASLDTLAAYADTGIAEADYRLLQSMILRTAEDCEDDDDEDSEGDEDSDSDSAPPSASEGDDSDADDDLDAEEGDDGEEGAEDESGEDYDFGGGDDTGGEGGQQYTVPEQAPQLPPEMMQEIPQDDQGGSAPVPPEVVDSLLGLPEGTIEQLLLQEAEQGARDGGGDFLGGAGGDNTEPPRVARRRRQAGGLSDLHREYGFGVCNVCGEMVDPDGEGHYENPDDPDDYCRARGRHGSRQFWAAPDESEQAMMGRQRQQQRDAVETGYANKYGPAPSPAKPNIQDLYQRAQGGDRDAYATLKGLYQQRGWTAARRQLWAADHGVMDWDEWSFGDAVNPYTGQHGKDYLVRGEMGDPDARWPVPEGRDPSLPNKHHARRFWAADDDQQSDGGGGGDSDGGGAQQGDPAAGGPAGMDPNAMGGMMPPPGSQAVQPPQPPQPIEDQPAEDALLDTANQAIMQMIDRETAEYQQIIGPLSQALQAVQFAQQVEQSEHPMDVTPPDGTVNVDPSQAPGGAQNPQQQLARLMRQAGGEELVGPGGPYQAPGPHAPSYSSSIDPWGDAEYGEQAPDMRLRHRSIDDMDDRRLSFEGKKVRALKNAAKLIGKTFGVNSGMLIEAMGRRNYEHVAEAFNILPPQALDSFEVRAAVRHIGQMFAAENPMFNMDAWMSSTLGGARTASRGRHPFDRPRLAGETWKNTPTMDRFEFANEQPEITDNMTINDLPKQTFKGLPKMKAHRITAGVPIHDITGEHGSDDENYGYLGGMPEDWYTHPHHYAPPDTPDTGMMQELYNQARGNPEHPVKVYMSVRPGQSSILPGDTVSPSYEYAAMAGYHPTDPGQDCPVISGTIPAKHLFTDGNNYHSMKYTGPHEVSPTQDWNPDERQDPFDPRLIGAMLRRLGWGTKGVAPKMPKMPSEKRGDDVMGKYQRYTDQRMQKGLNFGDNDVTVEDFLNEKHIGTEAAGKLHEQLGISHPPTPTVPATTRKAPVPKASNPVTKKGTWGEWEPPKTASFFTRRVPGWKWDDHLNGYISKQANPFTCSCGQKVAAPSYRTCDCGKVWNVYAIGDTHHLASDTADMFIAREIEVRPGVIMANRRMAGILDDHNGDWGEYFNSWAKWPGGDGHHDHDNRDLGELNPDDYKGWDPDKNGKPDDDDPRIKGANRKLAGADLRAVHYDRGYVRAWHPKRKDLDAEEQKYTSRYGDQAGDAFSEGWTDSVSDYPHRYKEPEAWAQQIKDDENRSQSKQARLAEQSHTELLAMIDKLAADNSGAPFNPGFGDKMDYFPTNTPGAGGIGADRANKGGQFNDGIKIDTSHVTTEDPPPTGEMNTKSGVDGFGQPSPVLPAGPELLGGGGQFGDASTNQDKTPDTFNGTPSLKNSRRTTVGENLAMIDKLADWTKYDDDVDPAVEAYGKNKAPSTKVSQPPKDWAKRKPAGDPSKKGGTWTPPPIPRKKK